MRKLYNLLFTGFLLLSSLAGIGQISYSETFDTGLDSWTTVGGFGAGQTTVNPCSVGSVRFNLYSGSTTNVTTSPSVGTSNGGTITLTYNYKVIDYTGGGATTNPWGTMLVQYASSASGPWTTAQTVDASNHTPSTTCALKTATFTPASGDLYIRFSSTWSAGDYYIYLDDINLSQGAPPACATPTGLSSTSITTTGAALNWNASASGTVTGYEWEVRTSGAGGSGATGLTASGTTGAAVTTANVSSLTSNTTYSFYVRTNCGSGSFSAWAGPSSFTTPCTNATLPYFQDFESVTPPAIPSCTSIENAGSGNNWYTSSNPGSGFTTKALRYSYNSANAANAWFYLQPVTLTAGTSYRLLFKYGNNSTFYTEKLEVKYGTAPNSASMTEPVVDYPAITGGTKQTSSTDFTPSATGTYYFGFHAYSIADQDQLYVDDIILMVTPTCEEPTALVFSNITSTDAQVDWTPPGVSSPVDYQVYVSTSSTAPTGSTTPTLSNIAATTANLTTLTPNTTYYVWVRSNCGGGDLSIWSAVASFKTLCTAATTFNENFDAVTTPALPSCWSKFLRGVAGIADVTTATGNAHSTPNAVTLYNSSSTPSAEIMLVSPPLSNIGAGTHRLKFWAKASVATEDLVIGTLDNTTSTANFTVVQTVDINTTYAEYTVDFTSFSGTDNLIAIKRLSTATFTNVYIDDIRWEVIPTCDAPSALVVSNITNAGADLDWTAPTIGSPVNYQVYISTTNTAPTGSTTPTLTGVNNPVTLSSLAASTTYYVWVRTNCGGTGVSPWSSSVSFTTLCNAITSLPWTENFDGLSTIGATNFPNCWKKQNGDFATSNAAFTTYNDPRSAPNYVTEAWSATNEFLWTPGFQLTAGTSYDFSFWFAGDGFNGWTGDVFYNTDQLGSGATQLGTSFITAGTTPVTTYTQVKNSFIPPSTGVYYFAIRINATSNPWYLGFDDFKLEVSPLCNEPTGVTVSNITTTGAKVDWTAPVAGSPVSYQLYYSTVNTAPTGSTTPTVSGVTALTYNLTGLSVSTTYYLWMRTFCGGTDVSAWTAVPVIFTTACNSEAIPTANQSFDVAAMPVCWSRALISGTIDWAPAANNDGVPSAHTGARFMGKIYNASDALVISQPINMTTAGPAGARINVWIYRSTANNATDRIRFHINTTASLTGATQLLEIFPKTTIAPAVASAGWYNYTADIPASYNTEPTVYILAQGTTDGSFSSYGIGFDDFKVEVIPTCNEPTGVTVSNLTTTGAQVNWTAPSSGSPVNYQIYYSTVNTPPTGSTTPTLTGVTGLSTTLSGLTANTTYYLWMRTFCGGTDVSAWTGSVVSFTTPCSATAVPYAQNFETAVVPALPSCSARENAGTGNNWVTVNNPGSGFTSKTLQYGYSSSSAADAWFYTQGLNLTGGTSYRLSFRYGNNSATYIEQLEVKYGTAPASASMTNLIIDYPSVTGGVPATANLDFTPSTTGVYYIGFHAHSIANQWNLYVDDIALTVSPLPVTLVSFTGTREGLVNRLSWTTATEINNSGFELERSADGRNFSRLASVASKAADGNSALALNYSFDDVKPLAGASYYRLKQIDKDGRFSYSNIVVLRSRVSDITITSVYPNPVKEDLNMVITSPSAEKVTMVVTDLSGKVIMQQAANVIIGDNQQHLNVQQLASGTYMVKVICANGCETAVHRFVKQ